MHNFIALRCNMLLLHCLARRRISLHGIAFLQGVALYDGSIVLQGLALHDGSIKPMQQLCKCTLVTHQLKHLVNYPLLFNSVDIIYIFIFKCNWMLYITYSNIFSSSAAIEYDAIYIVIYSHLQVQLNIIWYIFWYVLFFNCN